MWVKNLITVKFEAKRFSTLALNGSRCWINMRTTVHLLTRTALEATLATWTQAKRKVFFIEDSKKLNLRIFTNLHKVLQNLVRIPFRNRPDTVLYTKYHFLHTLPNSRFVFALHHFRKEATNRCWFRCTLGWNCMPPVRLQLTGTFLFSYESPPLTQSKF